MWQVAINICTAEFIISHIHVECLLLTAYKNERNTRLAKKREILIFPRIVGNTDNSREILGNKLPCNADKVIWKHLHVCHHLNISVWSTRPITNSAHNKLGTYKLGPYII